MIKLENLIVEGVDRLGKSTLIQRFKDQLGYFQVLHYQKPEYLLAYKPRTDEPETLLKRAALKKYQEESFIHMLNSLSTGGQFIMDRSHLGEAVYAMRYRGYDGDYVFDLEKEAIKGGQIFHQNTLLVLLTTSDFSFISDDGESHDFTKKEEEQADFKNSFDKTAIVNKLMIDVCNGAGGFKSTEAILNEVVRYFVTGHIVQSIQSGEMS